MFNEIFFKTNVGVKGDKGNDESKGAPGTSIPGLQGPKGDAGNFSFILANYF